MRSIGAELEISDRTRACSVCDRGGCVHNDSNEKKQTRSGTIDLHGIAPKPHTSDHRDQSKMSPSTIHSATTQKLMSPATSIGTQNPRWFAGYYAHQSIPAMVRTRLTENKLEWRQFDYEFEQYSYVSRFCAGNARNRPLRCFGQMAANDKRAVLISTVESMSVYLWHEGRGKDGSERLRSSR